MNLSRDRIDGLGHLEAFIANAFGTEANYRMPRNLAPTAGFLPQNPSKERDTMRGWFVFAPMVLMVFGPPPLPVGAFAVRLIVRGKSWTGR